MTMPCAVRLTPSCWPCMRGKSELGAELAQLLDAPTERNPPKFVSLVWVACLQALADNLVSDDPVITE